MSPLSAPMLATGSLSASHGTDRAQLVAAAKQFEAIFVRQMLAAARKADFGGDDGPGGQGMATFRQMQDDRFADIAAERGSFGMAKMIAAQPHKTLGTESPSRSREGLGVGPSGLGAVLPVTHSQPLPQAVGEQGRSSFRESN